MKTFEDIINIEYYEPKFDELVLEMIKQEHASGACIQRMLVCGYPKACKIREALIKLGYFQGQEQFFKSIITKDEFEKVIKNRK